MICTKVDELEKFMKESLKPSRYTHSLGVEKMARELAEIFGEDAEKAAFAGRYHDIAKCFTPDVMNAYVKEFGLPDMYIDNNPLAHSKVAAGILEHEFGVTDSEVLDAVRSHTTGRGNMSLLEEIIYCFPLLPPCMTLMQLVIQSYQRSLMIYNCHNQLPNHCCYSIQSQFL